MTNGVIPFAQPFFVSALNYAICFVSLVNDDELREHRLTVEIGRIRNTNKNAVAEKCIAELSNKLFRLCPEGRRCNLNTRIRDRRLSAREILY